MLFFKGCILSPSLIHNFLNYSKVGVNSKGVLRIFVSCTCKKNRNWEKAVSTAELSQHLVGQKDWYEDKGILLCFCEQVVKSVASPQMDTATIFLIKHTPMNRTRMMWVVKETHSRNHIYYLYLFVQIVHHSLNTTDKLKAQGGTKGKLRISTI